MHGLVNRSLQLLLEETYGEAFWAAVARAAGAPPEGFEPMLRYDPEITEAVLDAATARLRKSRELLLEDLGTFLISHEAMARVRRLLRFGGENFESFLQSLDDLPDRVRMVVPDLEMPVLELLEHSTVQYDLAWQGGIDGTGHILKGALSAVADDYGALVFLGDVGPGTTGLIRIDLLDAAHANGKSFTLAKAGV